MRIDARQWTPTDTVDHEEHSMCRAVTCKTCGKTTWAGCGEHIDSVKEKVPADQWCDGQHDTTGTTGAATSGGNFISRLFGR